MPTAVQEMNKNIVQRWIDEVFNSGRLDSVDELKVSGYLDWTPLPEPYQHTELPVSGIKDALPEWLAGLPDFHFSSEEMVAERDFVACLGHWGAHHAGDYKGLTPTNRRVGGTRIDIFRVAGDKMVEHWGCGNELAFLQLIGALAATPPPADAADVARGFVERVLSGRDVAAVAELLDPHAVDGGGQAMSLLALLQAFPDLELTVSDVAESGDDEISVVSTLTGTHQADYLGVPATGRRVVAERVDRFRVVDGRIAEWRPATDESALLAKLRD